MKIALEGPVSIRPRANADFVQKNWLRDVVFFGLFCPNVQYRPSARVDLNILSDLFDVIHQYRIIIVALVGSSGDCIVRPYRRFYSLTASRLVRLY